MTDPLLHTWNLNLGYAKRLVADIPDDKLAVQPAPGMNHAAWVLGHLACTADMLGAMIGVKPVCPAEWADRFDWSSSPCSDASQYPSKATLLQALEDAHAGIAAAKPAWTPAPGTIGLIWQVLDPVIIATFGFVFAQAGLDRAGFPQRGARKSPDAGFTSRGRPANVAGGKATGILKKGSWRHFARGAMTTVQEIEKAIESLSLADQLRLYRDMPQLIGRAPEDLEWQRLAIEEFFRDDAEDDALYDAV